MKTCVLTLVAFTLIAAAPPPPAPPPAPPPSELAPSEIVAAAPVADWVAIAPSDLLVMTLANGKRSVIQLMPAPFSPGWIGNIRKLAAAKWWDGLSINRVQDNYVVQWGDASEKKALPGGLVTVREKDYLTRIESGDPLRFPKVSVDQYAQFSILRMGWPVAVDYPTVHSLDFTAWPIHCYGMVGVGRNLSPDTGSGAELYTVIGHAPRHLDRNIALVGRVIEGIEHLSSLPRGTEALGFYKTPEERTTISSIRIGSDIADLPRFEYLSTERISFAQYADARANRRDPFFIKPAGGADICNIPVPVRRMK